MEFIWKKKKKIKKKKRIKGMDIELEREKREAAESWILLHLRVLQNMQKASQSFLLQWRTKHAHTHTPYTSPLSYSVLRFTHTPEGERKRGNTAKEGNQNDRGADRFIPHGTGFGSFLHLCVLCFAVMMRRSMCVYQWLRNTHGFTGKNTSFSDCY